MRPDLAIIPQLLHDGKERMRKLNQLLIRFTPIWRRPRRAPARDARGQDPVGRDDLAAVLILGPGVQRTVLPTAAADGLVADLHGRLLCDAVDRVVEGVFAVGADVLAAGGGVVVKALFGAKGFAVGEVTGRAGCDGAETAAGKKPDGLAFDVEYKVMKIAWGLGELVRHTV